MLSRPKIWILIYISSAFSAELHPRAGRQQLQLQLGQTDPRLFGRGLRRRPVAGAVYPRGQR
jgi:hypothetical protein